MDSLPYAVVAAQLPFIWKGSKSGILALMFSFFFSVTAGKNICCKSNTATKQKDVLG